MAHHLSYQQAIDVMQVVRVCLGRLLNDMTDATWKDVKVEVDDVRLRTDRIIGNLLSELSEKFIDLAEIAEMIKHSHHHWPDGDLAQFWMRITESTIKYGGVTEAQVKALLPQAPQPVEVAE